MTTAPQPPTTPGQDGQYTLSNLMPMPTSPPVAGQGGRLGPPPGYPPPAIGPQAPPIGPPRKLHWWKDAGTATQVIVILAAVFAPLLIIGLTISAMSGPDSASTKDLSVSSPSCRIEETVLGAVATVSFTVTNNGDKAARNVRVGLEYRDSGGARVDTDTARIAEVPAGDTVRVEESTNLDAAANGGSCKLVGISAD